jgi:hypothetical protein
MIRHFLNRVRDDPVALECEFEERAENAAPIVEGLERRISKLTETLQLFVRGVARTPAARP